jgi:hypothetical protein
MRGGGDLHGVGVTIDSSSVTRSRDAVTIAIVLLWRKTEVFISHRLDKGQPAYLGGGDLSEPVGEADRDLSGDIRSGSPKNMFICARVL